MKERIALTGPLVIPELTARVVLATDLDLSAAAVQVGQALGVTFKEDTEGLYEETYALVAIAMGHVFGLHEDKRKFRETGTRWLTLHVSPYTSPAWMGLSEYQAVFLYIADFLTALLRKETGLDFVAEPYMRAPVE